MKPSRLALTALLAVSVASAPGCGTVKRDKQNNALEAATSGYRKALRWGYYEVAYGYLHPSSRTPVPPHMKNISVTGYEVVQPPVRTGEDTATQVAHIEYIQDDVQRMRSISDRQQWRWDPDAGTWWLHSGIPDFR
jgi:hypothetical protein